MVPLYEVDANMCCTLLFQDKNETSPWEAEPLPCIVIICTICVKLSNYRAIYLKIKNILIHHNRGCTKNHRKRNLTFNGGKCVGSEGLAKSHMQISPSSAPDARRLGAITLNSRPRTWNLRM